MSRPLDLSAPLPAGSSWQDSLRSALQRLYASERFYRWSLGNPLTRFITRRRTRQLFDLMAGFVHSQVLLSCVRLQLFSCLREEPDTPASLAQRTGVPEPQLQRLLLSAVSLGLLEHRSGGRLGLGPLGVPLSTHDGIAQMVEHNQLLYQDLIDPLTFLRKARDGHMASYWPYAHGGQAAVEATGAREQVGRYSDLMAQSQGFLVQEILSSYYFDEHRCVLDVGAGQGRFASALACHAPHLKLKMFDLPPVLAQARGRLEQAGLAERVSLHPGSFLDDPLPSGADLVTLVRVAHDHPDAVVRQLFAKAHAALPAGGVLLVAEPMAQPPEAPSADQADAYYHFYLMAMGSGRLRTPQEIAALMREAGFIAIEQVPNPMPIHGQLVVGRKSQCLP
ncbi:MAG: methyltransferase [Limnohabitans sp.]